MFSKTLSSYYIKKTCFALMYFKIVQFADKYLIAIKLKINFVKFNNSFIEPYSFI